MRLVDNTHHSARLIANLHADPRRDVELPFAIHRHAVRAHGVAVLSLQAMESLAVRKRAIRLDLERPDPLAGIVGYVEQRVVRRQADAVRKRDPLLHDRTLHAGAVDEPHFFRAGIGKVNLAMAVDGQIVGAHPLRDQRLGSIHRIGDDALAAVLAGVEASVRAEHQAVRAARVFFENTDFAVGRDFMNPVVGDVREKYVALAVHRRSFGELVALADYFPILARIEDLGDVAALSSRRRQGDRLGVIAP